MKNIDDKTIFGTPFNANELDELNTKLLHENAELKRQNAELNDWVKCLHALVDQFLVEKQTIEKFESEFLDNSENIMSFVSIWQNLNEQEKATITTSVCFSLRQTFGAKYGRREKL